MAERRPDAFTVVAVVGGVLAALALLGGLALVLAAFFWVTP